MRTYTENEIISLIDRFEKQQLPKAEWTHEAHLVVAIWYLKKYDWGESIGIVRENIIQHNEFVGTPNTDTEGYLETITRFWLWTAQQFLKSVEERTIEELCNAFILSPYAVNKYPLEYYSRELLFSVHARKNWIEPDLNQLNKLV
jgi:hypothetical protein